MTNHIHLALQAGEIPLSRGLQNLSFRYTRWINWRKSSTDHLFQGRFKAVLVDSDSYLLELISPPLCAWRIILTRAGLSVQPSAVCRNVCKIGPN
jgi:hypothetical protein